MLTSKNKIMTFGSSSMLDTPSKKRELKPISGLEITNIKLMLMLIISFLNSLVSTSELTSKEVLLIHLSVFLEMMITVSLMISMNS
jgi:hypothetical protein